VREYPYHMPLTCDIAVPAPTNQKQERIICNQSESKVKIQL
jgi:hypothetical protein